MVKVHGINLFRCDIPYSETHITFSSSLTSKLNYGINMHTVKQNFAKNASSIKFLLWKKTKRKNRNGKRRRETFNRNSDWKTSP
jgi:hypothetical protein